MARIAYVNGRYLPLQYAEVSIEDRGFQFADGVYEVIAFRDGECLDKRGHIDRLMRSMAELDIAPPMTRTVLEFHIDELTRRNAISNGAIYIQITRGAAKRDFKFPHNVKSSIIMTMRHIDLNYDKACKEGISVITVTDQRWARRDIKTIALLPQVLAKQKAVEQGAYEAWMIDEKGFVTEGSSSNAWILTHDNFLITRKADEKILKGVTRTAVLSCCKEKNIEIKEQAFTAKEALEAKEAFISSANTFVLPVTRIDGKKVGDGKVGQMAIDLRAAYLEYSQDIRGSIPWKA